MGAAVSPPEPEVVGTTPAPLDAAVIPSAPTMPTVAANEPVPDAPQFMTESSMFGTPHQSPFFTLGIALTYAQNLMDASYIQP
jgi:hypothetical protein